MSTPACEICGNTAKNRVFTALEMMFGSREPYDYLECGTCGCLQLLDLPDDLSSFYPSEYYSLAAPPEIRLRPVASALRKTRAIALLHVPAATLDACVNARWVSPALVPTEFMWLAGLGLKTTSSVCDVGSGSGHLLAWMLSQGFSRLAGFDPYIAHDLSLAGRISIRRLAIDDIPGRWDLIMLNHSFEHMPHPAKVLSRLATLLNDFGSIVIRIPIADSWAWRTYGTNWVQLDAPRHLYLHTRRSMRILAEKVGLKVSRVFFDSTSFQFWGSEQYEQDIPHRDPRSYGENPNNELFTASEIKRFQRRARRMNEHGVGDSAGFVLQRHDG